MPELTVLEEGETLEQTLMPEGLCARCDAEEPQFWWLFDTERGAPESVVRLGFCSNDCFDSFVRGIDSVSSLPGL